MFKGKLFLQQHRKLTNLPLCGLSLGGGRKNKLIQGGKSICWGWSQAASVTLQFIENGLVGLQELAAGQKLLLLQQVDFRSVDLYCLLAGLKASKPWGYEPLWSFEQPLIQVHFFLCAYGKQRMSPGVSVCLDFPESVQRPDSWRASWKTWGCSQWQPLLQLSYL